MSFNVGDIVEIPNPFTTKPDNGIYARVVSVQSNRLNLIVNMIGDNKYIVYYVAPVTQEHCTLVSEYYDNGDSDFLVGKYVVYRKSNKESDVGIITKCDGNVFILKTLENEITLLLSSNIIRIAEVYERNCFIFRYNENIEAIQENLKNKIVEWESKKIKN